MQRRIEVRVRKRESIADDADWRYSMRRRLFLLLTVKFAALMLLWWLFFSPPHRQHIDGAVASEHLSVAPPVDVSGSPQPQERIDD